MDQDADRIREALRKLPEPPLRPGFVDRALAVATAREPRVAAAGPRSLRRLARSWDMWIGMAVGVAATAAIAVFLLRPLAATDSAQPQVTLAVNEARSIDVLIESERPLDSATIRILVSGAVELDGFDRAREIDWQARLDRGSNLLSVPVVARAAGTGRLIAIVEHDGRTRRVAIDLSVIDSELRT